MAERPDALATILMTQGGDARIVLKPETGLNKYFSAPRPSAVLAYASSTANDISAEAFAHVEAKLREIAPAGELSASGYAGALAALRARVRRAYSVPEEVAVVFAPSGTDLEYVALACAVGKAAAGTHNILLGADEVGSGCVYSAYGQYFAESTALGRRRGSRCRASATPMSRWSTCPCATPTATAAARPRSATPSARRSAMPRQRAVTRSSISCTVPRLG
jgi:hypothetical protein